MKRAARLAFEEQRARRRARTRLRCGPGARRAARTIAPAPSARRRDHHADGTRWAGGGGAPDAARRGSDGGGAAEARSGGAGFERGPVPFRAEARSPSRAFRSGRDNTLARAVGGVYARVRERGHRTRQRGAGRGAASGGGTSLPASGAGPRRRTQSLAARTAGSVSGVGPPGPGPSLPGCFSRWEARPFAPAPPARRRRGWLRRPGRRRRRRGSRARDRDPRIGSRRIRADPGPTRLCPAPAPPPRAGRARALFSSTAEKVTQIVGSSGGTRHALGDGHHRRPPRVRVRAPALPGAAAAPAPYAYPAYPGAGHWGPAAAGAPGSRAPRAEPARSGPPARIGAAEAPRPSGERSWSRS